MLCQEDPLLSLYLHKASLDVSVYNIMCERDLEPSNSHSSDLSDDCICKDGNDGTGDSGWASTADTKESTETSQFLGMYRISLNRMCTLNRMRP